ncbi:TraR/DksA family transcriptional regulator [Massilia sp. ST3]|uniref:TraR/DksA family transcriptional regulator n=1 Tax=Massilia sp. ST3 TaxID=2824903 RepID=UPI001E3AEA0E|nr:TraR/DksA family transcriptional regulator [Massilia sp. ST3]
MPPLSQSVHDEMTRRLQQARESTLRTVRARTDAAEGEAPAIGPLSHEVPGDDRVTAEMISHDEEHFAGHEAALLHEIDVALGKLEAGGAGICESCGCEIPEARLLATPTVRMCIGCQEQTEKEQRTGRGPSM